jgi:hypothetical protein
MANFPGGIGAAPGVYDEILVRSSGVSVPGGLRLAAILGEGARIERLISAAVGSGNDGLNSSYTSSNGRDGRHFKLTYVPIISNRTTLYKNGIPLVGLEQANFAITGGPTFSYLYDYRIDINNGEIELQTAALVDQGGTYTKPSALNVGNGIINGVNLIDVNAPTESWTVRCVSVIRDTFGVPIDGYARFIAQGSVSGVILDGYGSQIVWQSNGTVIDNTILQFSITEGSTAFRENDTYTIKVKSGALIAGDSLIATYICVADLNDPQFFSDPSNIQQKHGSASTSNTLSLGAQLAFANGPPGIWACQAAPSVPRRVSYSLEPSASGYSADDDMTFDLPLGVVPDVDSTINFFVTDPITQTENQILPNKVAFYDPAITASPAWFISTGGGLYHYSYTVVMKNEIAKVGYDGIITPIGGGFTATLSSPTVTFGIDDLSATRSVHIHTPATNAGTYSIIGVHDGYLAIQNSGLPFVTELVPPVTFEVIDTAGSSAKILFTRDLALGLGQSLRATVVDTKDADFFDVGWQSAYEAIEAIECDIVVPLPRQTISAIFQAGRIHCDNMSNIKNRKERMLFIGAISGLTPFNIDGTELAAVEDIGVLEGIQGDEISEILAGNVEDLTDYEIQNSFGSTCRVVYMYPDQIVVQVGSTATLLDGFYMAPAAAGYFSGVPNVNMPLTNKNLAGFSIRRDRLFRPSVIERIINAGACLVQPAAGGGTVIWGRTTSNSGFPEDEEISIVFIRDRMSKSLRSAFQGFIGSPEDASGVFVGTLKSRANKVFQSFISQRLITAYRNIRVARDSVEPRQWNISGEGQPVYPVNWVYISVSVGVLD